MTTAQSLIFIGLSIIAVGLTATMFITKERLLGFPCGIFYALLGGYSFTLSASTWDIYYLIGFACLLGMVVFTIYSAFALREKRDSIADKSMENGEGKYIDESPSVEIEGENTRIGKRRIGINPRKMTVRERLEERRKRRRG